MSQLNYRRTGKQQKFAGKDKSIQARTRNLQKFL